MVENLRPLLLGAHLSIAGGVHRALERAHELRCAAVQLFTGNQRQWRVKSLSAEEIREFHEARAKLGPFVLASHAGYLINLASPDRVIRERSVAAAIAEIERCGALAIPRLVLHPGAHLGAGEPRGLARVATALNRVHRATAGADVLTCLEITAGQGSGLGYRFDHLAAILRELEKPERLRVCFDTAHAIAAGYDFRSPAGYRAMWSAFDAALGLDRLAVFHLNDSGRELGSRCDRHTHIGRGTIGRRPFGWILADPRFADLPKVIETPKEDDMDVRNLRLLRRLARSARTPV